MKKNYLASDVPSEYFFSGIFTCFIFFYFFILHEWYTWLSNWILFNFSYVLHIQQCRRKSILLKNWHLFTTIFMRMYKNTSANTTKNINRKIFMFNTHIFFHITTSQRLSASLLHIFMIFFLSYYKYTELLWFIYVCHILLQEHFIVIQNVKACISYIFSHPHTYIQSCWCMEYLF